MTEAPFVQDRAGRAAASGLDGAELAAWGGILGLGTLVSWLCRVHPAALPFWMPWDFSWPEFLSTTLALWWFGRGRARMAAAERPAGWRQAAFLTGVALIYAVLQTRFAYMALHMFFLNRVQHVVMHHVGPFLVGLGAAGPVLRRGMPPAVRRIIASRPVAAVTGVVQQPVVAVLLFVGLFYVWLIPPVHFRAMLDARLYAVMNWSMVVDGLLFWSVVLDARPKPPARLSFGTRAAMVYATTFPEIALGYALTAIGGRDLYPFYALCGRLYPAMSAITDQQIGGLIIWVPPAMMGAGATGLVLATFLRHEQARGRAMEAAENGD